VVPQTFESILIQAENNFWELVAQRRDYIPFEVWARRPGYGTNPAFEKKALRTPGR
jgi:hypothetical protein